MTISCELSLPFVGNWWQTDEIPSWFASSTIFYNIAIFNRNHDTKYTDLTRRPSLPLKGCGPFEREPIIGDLYNADDIRCLGNDEEEDAIFLFEIAPDEIRQIRQSQRKSKANQLRIKKWLKLPRRIPEARTNPTVRDKLRHDMVTAFVMFFDLFTEKELEMLWEILLYLKLDDKHLDPKDQWMIKMPESRVCCWAMEHLYGERYTLVSTYSWPAEFMRQGDTAKRILEEAVPLNQQNEHGQTSVTPYLQLQEPNRLEGGRTTDTVEDVLEAAAHRVMRRHNATNPAEIPSYDSDMVHELAEMVLERIRMEQWAERMMVRGMKILIDEGYRFDEETQQALLREQGLE
ncbi:hypothetical protein VHEMI06521 [[Torrubiella] hemipterigena]|uniref:Uncharacterized protein n=1 Tax=[Torrubiella] hemipterigena TaxID=1531966 RepID=A0A0A1TJC0_9HYPO|nr:hypothetical protein VHEMI06521 [[Torrubiella] hemipterigena]